MILKEEAACLINHPLRGELASRVCTVAVCFGILDLVCTVLALLPWRP